MPKSPKADMIVQYFVQTREKALSGCFQLTLIDTDVKLHQLKANFPYEGNFAFRAKVRAKGAKSSSYMWMDVTEDDAVVPRVNSDVIVVKALPLFDTKLSQNDDFTVSFSLDEYEKHRQVVGSRFPVVHAKDWELLESNNNGVVTMLPINLQQRHNLCSLDPVLSTHIP